ncbi:MAG: redoxin domain-containing protein [Sphingobacteriaceae bacterium]|nr:redoxin domain-containing protein [Sphingobacteriaceae bacterium]
MISKIIVNNKNTLLLTIFILQLQILTGQSSLADSVINSYHKFKAFNYNLKRLYFSSSDNICDTFYSEIFVRKIKGDIHYLIDYKKRFIAVRNTKHFGYNDLPDKKFTNYKLLNYDFYPIEAKLKPHFIFNPNEFRDILNNKSSLIINRKNFKDFILIETVDTLRYFNQDSSTMIKSNLNKYYISKKDYRIFKTSNHPTTINHVGESHDSIVYYFSYKNSKKNEIIKTIENFIPYNSSVKNNKQLKPNIEYFPEFSGKDTSSILISSKDIKSKFVLVEFWYKGCSPCIANMKNLQKIRNSISEADLQIIAYNEDDPINKQTISIVKKINNSIKFLFNYKNLTKAIPVEFFPTTYIYRNTDRKIIYYDVGGGSDYTQNVIQIIKEQL